MWHNEPKNDAWREVHLAHVESLGNRLWLRCNACGHSITPEPRTFANEHHLEMTTRHCCLSRVVSNAPGAMSARHTVGQNHMGSSLNSNRVTELERVADFNGGSACQSHPVPSAAGLLGFH